MALKNTILEPKALFQYCPRCGSQSIESHEDNAIKCKSCHFVYFFNASGAVIGIILNGKNGLLVTKRAFEPFKGKLDLPGGFIAPGESAEDAFRREVKEELNLDVTELTFCYSLPNQYPYSGMIVHTIDLIFKAKVESFERIKAGDDVASFAFVNPSDLKPGDFGIDSVRQAVIRLL